MRKHSRLHPQAGQRHQSAALTVGFTRAAGLVKEPPDQEQLQARLTADFGRRQPRRVEAWVSPRPQPNLASAPLRIPVVSRSGKALSCRHFGSRYAVQPPRGFGAEPPL
jgi:hypothetical protein